MTERTLARNTTYYTAALTVQKILSFVYFWFISSRLFPDQLGQYVFALSFASLFSILIDLGLSPVLTREAAKKDEDSNNLLANILGIKIPLAIITLLVIWLVITLSSKPESVKMLVYLASFVTLLDSFSLTFWMVFRAKHNLKFESIATIFVQSIIFVLGLTALFLSGSIFNLILALLAASIFNFLFGLSLLKIKLKFSLKPRYHLETIIKLLKIMPAFALAGIFVKIYNVSDSVLLSFLASDQAVGLYSVPYKVILAFQQIIPVAFAAVIFPAFSYYYVHSKEKLEESFTKAYRYLLIISIPLSAGLVFLAEPIIVTIWPNYQPVINTFTIMSLALPFIFLAFPTGYMLNACDRQRNTTFVRGVGVVLSVAFNLILIPWLGYFGAGITFLITNVALLFLDFWFVKKIIKINWAVFVKIFGQVLLATLAMVVIILSLSKNLNIFLVAPIGAISYFACLYLLGGFKFAEFKFIKS
ncbi:MAG: flippase [Candidatus Buchananbacteria bacterium]|nr:flippase [Candidatus Buchananbacteria bacterium]